MCGIAGIACQSDRHSVSRDLLSKMTNIIAHRGPDDAQAWLSSDSLHAGGPVDVGLGFRRLSIIDLEGAKQPMANEDGSVHLVFNGEIYNFKTLRSELESAGHRYSSNGDGESILHLYEDLGTDCFSKLNGMFAAAIWDSNRNRLVLARDRIGQKPLYYAVKDGRLVFGSELKCLSVVEGICTEIDPVAVDEFLAYQYIPHPRTIWKGVHKLPPGHFAIFENGEVTVRKYWSFDPSVEHAISAGEARERLLELMTDSVRLRMQSDVPLGSFLSGGVDSSLITAVAQELSTQPVRTFSIGFPISEFDETQYAAEVAKHLGTRHQRLEVTPSGVEVIDKLVWHYDEPFSDSSAVPTWYLSELARKEVKVALAGDGGDELFAGYGRYRELHARHLLQKRFPIHRFPGMKYLGRLPGSSRRDSFAGMGKRFIDGMNRPPSRQYFKGLQIFGDARRETLYSDGFIELLPDGDPSEFLAKTWARSEGRDLVTRAAATDILSYLPCDLCVKVDIASMGHGLEVRQPMLDHRLVEFAASLPVGLKFQGDQGKLLLKDAYASKLPKSVFTRKKMGFGVPIDTWLRGELNSMVHDTLLSQDSKIQPYFCSGAVERLVGVHEKNAAEAGSGYQLWNLLILEKWMREWA
jgi:asparagine synthase (glutamine-hydrolysing)